MVSHKDVCKRFYEGRRATGSNVFTREANGRMRLYSYGAHFILAVKLDTPHEGVKWLLNGDNYSVSTAKHQGYARYTCPDDYVIIPFSTLDRVLRGTGLTYEELQISDHTPDQTREVPYIDPETGEEKTRTEHLLGSTLFHVGQRYYLSSTDNSAKSWGQGYFLVQLPGPCKTVDQAYEMLKPKEVGDDTPYVRQGEYFFVPRPDLTTRDIARQGVVKHKPAPPKKHEREIEITEENLADFQVMINRIEREITTGEGYYDTLQMNWKGEAWAPGSKVHVVGTYTEGPRYPYNADDMKGNILKGLDISKVLEGNDSGNPHRATDVMITEDGRIFARRTVRHPEHKMINLRKTWHRVYQNRAVNSWSTDGRVD